MSPTPPRPFVHANCAVSADGRLAYAGGQRALLSGPKDLTRVQELRAEADGILVGVGTIILDDPSLRVHYDLLGRPEGRHPTRIVLDSLARTPTFARVLAGPTPTIVATAEGAPRRFPPTVQTIAAGKGRVDLARLLPELRARGIARILVEGGGEVLASFFRGGYVDRFTVYIAPVLIGGKHAPTLLGGTETHGAAEAIGLIRESVEPLDDGTLLTYGPRRPPGAPL